MVLVIDTVKQRKLLKSSTHVTQTIFKNVKHIDGSKTKCYCYMRRHGEFGRKTNLDSLKLLTLKGVIQKCSKKLFCVIFHLFEKQWSAFLRWWW